MDEFGIEGLRNLNKQSELRPTGGVIAEHGRWLRVAQFTRQVR